MGDEQHLRSDRWRVIVVRSNAPEVLFVEDGQSLALPEIQIPCRQRIAWHLNDQLKQVWQLPVVSIMPLPPASSPTPSVRYYLAQFLSTYDGARPPHLRWVDPSVAMDKCTLDPQDRAALYGFVRLAIRDKQRGPFSSAGWFEEVSAWLSSAAAALGLEWDGSFEQFNATDSFSLIRFATKPRVLWFKAVGPTFATEFHVMKLLARKLPGCVPRLVAAREEWLAWLTEECPGKALDTGVDFALWQNAVSTLARLQIASTSFVSDLLDAQAHPLQQILSHASIERFHGIARNLLSADKKRTQEKLADDELAHIEETLHHHIDATSNSGIPDALGHLDLNSGNVVVSQDHCAYLDWAEAYVGFPLLSFEYLLQSFRRAYGVSSPQERDLIETYLSAWDPIAAFPAVREAWASTPMLAVFAYFLRCIDRCEGQLFDVPGRAEYLSSLLRKLSREVAKTKSLSPGVLQ